MKQEKLVIGTVLKPQGIKGEVKVKLYTDDIENYNKRDHYYIKKNNGVNKINVEKSRIQSGFLIVKFESIQNRNEAELLRGNELLINKSELNKLDDEEFYYSDLIGLKVLSFEKDNSDIDSKDIGAVTEVFNNGANFVLTVKIIDRSDTKDNNKSKNIVNVPFIDEAVKEINLEEGYILVNSLFLEN